MGFDNECILNIQSLAGEYFCPVCRLLVYPNEAIQSQCTHLYCKPCLTYIVSTTRACPYDGYLVTEADSKPLVESNKALAETIGKVAVHCLYHRSGCTWQGPLSDCTSHCSSCAFGNSPVVCNRCGIQIVHRQVQEHAQNCPGVQPQAPQAEAGQDASASGTAVAVDQSQTVTQAGAATSQAQISQAAAVTSVQDNNSQVNSNPQVQAVAQPAVLTQEQWYQQQQQYQQYYQQYPGYDPYQQHYQQYYPYQQQAVQQYQQQHLQGQPQLVPGQPPPQVYAQPQAQPQPPAHSQTQPQIQIQPPSQPQPQPQPQPHPHVQAPVVAQNQTQTPVNPQQQLHPVVQPHSQIPSQILPPPHGQPQPQPQPQPYSQAQTYAQPHPVQPYAAQHPQMPQYQQPHPQMQHPQSQLQPQPHSQHPQHHPPPQPQSQPHPQVAPQAQVQHHAQLHNQPRPAQPTPTPNPTAHPQIQHTSALAVTGHHSYPQPQPYQQMQSGALQQHSIHMHSQSGSHQQPQHPGQMQGQFPPQPPQMRPPQSHVPMPNQQQPALLPSPGPVPNMPPAQPQPAYPHGLQPGHPAQQRPVMQSMQQQPLPPQFVQQQQQAFPGQPLGLALNQLHQQAPFVQQQQPIQSPIRPQGPPQSLQQLPGYPQSQQSAALSHGLQSQQPLNHIGRPMIPNQGLPSQPYPQSHGGVTGAAHVRPLLPSSGQLPATQNYPPRANSQLQSSSEQQLGYIQQSAHSQSAATSKTTVFEKQGDNISEKNVAERDADSASQKTDRKDGSGLVVTSDPGADSVDLKSLKSESDIKSVGDEKKQEIQNDKSPSIVESMHAQTAEPETHATEYGLDPVVKQMVKRESANNTLETSATGKSVESVVEQKVVSDVEPKQGGHSFEGKEIQEGSLSKSPLGKQLEFVEDKRGKLQNDAVDSLTRADKGLQFVPPASAPISSNSVQIAQSKGQIPGSEGGSLQTPPFSRDTLHHQERNMPQGPGVDEYRGFPPPGQAQGKGFAHPSHSVPHTDPGRHQLPPMPYGPSHQQRPDASLMLPVPPQGPLHQAQVPLQPPMQLRPHGPGPLSQPGQPFPPPEHLQPPLLNQPHGPFRPEIPPGGGFPSGGPALPLGRGPGHMGPNQRNFEPRSITPQGPYNQGHMPPPHAGAPRTSQGELVGGPPFGGPPPRGSFDSPGVMMARPPQHGPDAHAGLQRPTNPMEAEMFPNQRPGYFDSRHSDSHLPGSLERGPIGLSKMNGPSGPDSSSALGLRNGRFKPLPEDHVNSFPMEPNRRVSDRVEYEDDLRQFPRPSNLDMEPGLKSTGNISSLRPVDRGPHGLGMDAALRPLEKAPHGFNYDGVVKLDSNASTGPPRFHPPFHPSGTLHPNDAGERSRPLDIGGRVDHPYSRPDFLEQVPGFGRHHVDGRSPAREYPGAPSRGFGGLTGAVGNRSGTDDVDGRESGRFGEGSKPFNLSLDPIGNTFNESRYAGLPSRMRRSDLDGPGNLRTGEHFPPGPHSHLRNSDSLGQDSLPSHLRRGEHFGPRNLPSHLRLGEPAGFGAFPGHAQVDLPGIGNFPQNVPFGESFRGGNKPNHPRLGEPGFRSSYSLQGFSNDSGFFKGDMEPFDNSRKRKSSSMGWCRICKVDCETVEGLDLHSQTREHQKMAMDMVLSIKQQNAKKHKTSNDHSSLEEASKSRNASLDGRSNKH